MYKRIVVKIGTKVISTPDKQLDRGILRHLVEQIIALRTKGIQVIVVTSGAVGAGRGLLQLPDKGQVTEKQVYAAVGQVKLMSIYSELLAKHGYLCAQILVTKEDFRDRVHYLNIRNCFESLLLDNVVPIVNENDVVATTELLFTDNDELAGLVASQLDADAVVILTSVAGVLTGDPSDRNTQVVSEIDTANSAAVAKHITPEKTAFGRGGMLTKFSIACKLAVEGIATHIVDGRKRSVLVDLLAGRKIGTKFIPQRKLSATKRRLAHAEGLARGSVTVNECTGEMLRGQEKIMSLLPVGILRVTGDFLKGDIIEIKDHQGRQLGFGISQYDAGHVQAAAGQKNGRPVIHYNYMFINA